MVKKIVLGNVITMDEYKPNAESVVVENGKIKYVGSFDVAKQLAPDAEIMDYGDNYVYPGFIETHAHGFLAANRLELQADLSEDKSMAAFLETMTKYIEEHPGRDFYEGAGWDIYDEIPTRQLLDQVNDEIPICLNSIDGHSIWLNTPGCAKFGIDEEAVKKYGTDLVRVDEDGVPTGYLSEEPAINILLNNKPPKEGTKAGLLKWQELAFSQGITATGEALSDEDIVQIYSEAVEEGKFKFRTYGMFKLEPTIEDVEKEVDNVLDLKKYDGEYYKTVAIKLFLDGVVEAHTGWMEEEYIDDPGYYGDKRFTDLDKFAEITKVANEKGFFVHVHSVGDGATKFGMDGFEKAQLESGIFNMRNSFAHLQYVNPKDIKRMADFNVCGAIPPLWIPKSPSSYIQECEYLGEERALKGYPMQSFINEGATVSFHSDYPVSTALSVPISIYMAVTGKLPEDDYDAVRNPAECMSQKDAVLCLTKNAAYMLNAEDEIGSLEIGKLANMVVYDKDFLNDDIEEIAESKLIATIIEGDVVFKS
ncbi:MAG: amidohydrolase [Methanobacteriaceae archaeon]|nr:amidohydrolase [Methanobacteriaceae archaeon]